MHLINKDCEMFKKNFGRKKIINYGDIAHLREVFKKKMFCGDHAYSSLDHPNPKKFWGSLVYMILRRLNEGLRKISIFYKMAIVEKKNTFFYQVFFPLFRYKIKNIHCSLKSFVQPPENYMCYK